MIILLLFALMFLLMALGLPIALAIGLPAIGLIVTPGVFPATVAFSALGQTVVQQLFSGVDSFDLLAVPLFMIAGALMETGGISRRLIDFCDSLVGWAPGGLAAAAIVASMIIAGISGSAAADTAAIGAVVAAFSLAGSLVLAFAGATAFGAAAAFTLASGMGAIQSRLDGDRRVVAFAAFHVVIRIALGVAAIAAGIAGDLLGPTRWPGLGLLAPSRVVLLGSGLLILASSLLVREQPEPVAGTEPAT